jgi:dienelactone hydrolase
MANILLFHSMLGLRPAIVEAAVRLRGLGHEVEAPDLFDGAVFSEYGPAKAHADALGLPEIFARAAAAARGFGPGAVYAGFSLGAACALGAAARMPGARACVAVAGVVSCAELRAAAWPAGVPVQLHFSLADPAFDRAKVQRLGSEVLASGSGFESEEYETGGHLFMDPGLPDFDEGAAGRFWASVAGFLARI